MNKLLKLFAFAAYLSVAIFSTNVSAVAILDFGTGGAGSGGTIADVSVLGDGTHIVGTAINIGSFEAVGTSNDGVHAVTSGFLNFDTGANTITIDGIIAGLGINASIPLLSGSFTTWTYDDSLPTVVFNGSGVDVKHDDLLSALGLSLNTPFEFFGFTLGFDTAADPATAISTDFINTSVVPVPAAVWLFGFGLLGLVGVARRK